MSILLLFCSMLCSAIITVGSRLYRGRTEGCEGASGLYNFLVPASATFGWLIVFLTEPSFDDEEEDEGDGKITIDGENIGTPGGSNAGGNWSKPY